MAGRGCLRRSLTAVTLHSSSKSKKRADRPKQTELTGASPEENPNSEESLSSPFNGCPLHSLNQKQLTLPEGP